MGSFFILRSQAGDIGPHISDIGSMPGDEMRLSEDEDTSENIIAFYGKLPFHMKCQREW